jgi:hypothetical protein
MRIVLAVSVAAVMMACGCMSQSNMATCPDGTTVSDLLYCPGGAPTTTVNIQAVLAECDRFKSDDDRNGCYTNAAASVSDLGVCDRINNSEWRWVCYDQLNQSSVLGPLDISTTTLKSRPRATTTTTDTTTTTLSLCGNGVIDEGEECDPGALCKGDDAVCGISGTQRLVTCMAEGICDWNSQNPATGAYDLGRCNGCFREKNESACKCLGQQVVDVLNITYTVGGVVKTENPPPGLTYHVCQEGRCLKSTAPPPIGTGECSGDSGCRHTECVKSKCTMFRTPGPSTCTEDAQCAG